MRNWIEIARAGLDGLRLYPLRAGVTVACVAAVLTPHLAGLGISQAIRQQADESIEQGANLYVSGTRFGEPAAIPLTLSKRIRELDGVTKVVPRIIGQVRLGRDDLAAVVVGIAPTHWPDAVQCIDGRLPRDGGTHEVVLGTEIAARLGLRVGDRIPPFYHGRLGDRVSTVVGLFKSDISLWQANIMLMTLEAAAAVFEQGDSATDLAVYCRPGYEATLATAIAAAQEKWPPSANGGRLRIVPRSQLAALLPRQLLQREGIFNLHFVLAFAVGIPLVLVTSGIGQTERRRETGLLKALGWQTDEILIRGLIENFVLCLLAASLAVIVAFAWLRLGNGVGIAALFLPDVGFRPGFRIPFQLTPLPALLTLLISLAVVMAGTLWSTWRTAVTAPIEAMR
ncbi:MAG: ABC transporter permease [Pirellulales bacterium]